MTIPLHTIGSQLIVKPVQTASSAILITNQKPSQYYVCSIGPDVKSTQINDILYLTKHAGTEIEHEKEKYIIIDESQILAILDT